MQLTSVNPATGCPLWEGESSSQEFIINTFDKAKRALPFWSKLSFERRAEWVFAFKEEVVKQRARFAELISQETGKPHWEALTEVDSVIAKVDISIDAYQTRTSQKEIEEKEANGIIRYKPHGVVAVLGPFNFPAHLPNGHIIPALLAGNTVVFKPSEQTPAVGEFLVKCWQTIQLPEGVINCIQGDKDVAQSMLKQPLNGIFFTGSYQTGVALLKQFATKPEVILALEMGGNNALIIDNDIDLETGIYHTLLSSFITSGQRCSAARRIFIPKDSFGDEFLDRLIAALKQLKIGPYTDTPEPFMGPVISEKQVNNLLLVEKNLQALGGNVLLEMKPLKKHTGFISPGVIDMTVVASPPDEEYFGPLIQVYRYGDFEHAIYLANQTKFGLSAGLLSHNSERFELFYNAIQAGLINWNRPTTGASSKLPFGGIGYSGNHRPSAYFAADYSAYPVASLLNSQLMLPKKLLPGITFGVN